MASSKSEVLIIGGGLVGLATALKILEKRPNTKLTLLEKEDRLAQHQSGNNSGVIHSGVYYQPGSLRAKNCLKGYDMLLDFCAQHEIRHEICGKVIVATKEEQMNSLMAVYKKGVDKGMQGLRMIEPEEIKEREPHVKGIKAIWVPQAGICDFPGVAIKYGELIESKGGTILTNHKVSGIEKSKDGYVAKTNHQSFEADLIISCAGLYADRLAQETVENLGMKILPFRGEYYKIKKEKRYLVNHLIYPAPDPAFPWLGVHFTRMINGDIEAGPNAVLAFRREGYKKSQIHMGELFETVRYSGFRSLASKFWKVGLGEFKRSFSKKAFTKALQGLLPELEMADLEPGGAGVRALACDKKGNLIDDFMFLESDKIIHVLNAPSPAATASLSIGDTIADKALKQLS